VKILIIKWGALGDILATVPTIIKIREIYSDAKIIFLTSSISELIFKDSSIVDIIINRKKQSILENIMYLRKQNFDIVFNLKWGSESADLYALLSKSKVKIGGSKKGFFRIFYDFTPERSGKYYDFNRHEYLKNLDILQAYQKNIKYKNIKSYITIDKSKKILDFLENKKTYIVVAPAASTLTKAWQKENYISLCKKIIAEYNYNIIATYTLEDFDYTKEIVDAIGNNAYLSPKTTINELAYIVKNAFLCICNNSGIMHVAYAVNTPVMCFNTSIGWHPFGKNDISIDRIPEEIVDNRSLNGEQVQKLLSTINIAEAFSRFQEWEKNYL
jgi:heptosyltransferase-2